MGIFNGKLNRLIGNKKQKKVAEMLAEMLLEWEDGKDGKDGQDSGSDDESSGSLPGIYKIKFHNSMSGSEQFSATVNFTDIGINEGVSTDFENIYIIPLYGNSGELDNGILPVPLLPLKELLLMGEYIHCEINPNVSDQLICQKIVLTAQSRFNPNQEEDEYWYTGLKLEIFNMTFENIPK